MNTIKLDFNGEIAQITLCREPVMNALNLEMLFDLERAVNEIECNQQIRCLIITGQGEKAFAAGADVGAMEQMDEHKARALAQKGCCVMDMVAKLRIPVIAAINGYALGGGMELALACDIRIASKKAVLGLPEVMLGVMPGWGGTRRLPQVAGYANAAWMVFSGEWIDAEEAYRMNIVNMVTEPEELMDTALRLAKKICSRAPLGVAGAKKALREYAGADMPGNTENELFASLFGTQDQKTGMKNFNHKQKTLRFEGR